MIGRTISQYRILDAVGDGGIGAGYKAEDLKLRRTVALTFLPPEYGRDPDEREHLIRETQAASTLRHTNICTIHHAGETDEGGIFIVTDYDEGETLRARLHAMEGRPMPVHDALRIAMQVAAGLEAAHEVRIVHRDIRPENIMLTRQGTVKILHFGLAGLRKDPQLKNEQSTPAACVSVSPGQAGSGKMDVQQDIWSFGILLFEMMTGRHPFGKEHGETLAHAVQNGDPPPILDLNPAIPCELGKLIDRCLQNNPANRPSSAEELLLLLMRIDADIGSVSQGGERPVIKGWRWKRWIAAGALIVGCAIIVALGYIFVRILFHEHHSPRRIGTLLQPRPGAGIERRIFGYLVVSGERNVPYGTMTAQKRCGPFAASTRNYRLLKPHHESHHPIQLSSPLSARPSGLQITEWRGKTNCSPKTG